MTALVSTKMSPNQFFEENSKVDALYNIIKDLQFLQFSHSIEQIKPAHFDFPAEMEFSEVCQFSAVGLDLIQSFLHIGLVSETNYEEPVHRNRILMTVWPQFVSPAAYGQRKAFLPGIKKIKTLVFRVPESVFRSYEVGSAPTNNIIAAVAVLTPVTEWKLLEKLVISSFYHLMFDKPTTDICGNVDVWKNYSIDKLNDVWKQLLFICCSPQPVAYVFKRLLKRNWARLARLAVFDNESSDDYTVCQQENLLMILIQWSKYSFKNTQFFAFLNELNSNKPILITSKILEMAKIAFATCVANSKTYRCQFCPYETNANANFVTHVRKHTGERPFSCTLCDAKFKSDSNLKFHKLVHSGVRDFICKFCGRGFFKLEHLKIHLGRIHIANPTYQCHSCKLVFNNETDLLNHIPLHANDPVFQCVICLRRFNAESRLKEHSRVHSEDKPFKCDKCNKGYKNASLLNSHMQGHSESSNFDCEFCQKSFKRNGIRISHQITVHGKQYS